MMDLHKLGFCLLPFKGSSEVELGSGTFFCCLAGKWEVDEMKETKLPGDKGLVLISFISEGPLYLCRVSFIGSFFFF